MIHVILDYFRYRKLKVPGFLPAIMFAYSEMGEIADAIMRGTWFGDGWIRNNEREVDIGSELADAYMQLELAAHALDLNLQQLLLDKMRSKEYYPITDRIIELHTPEELRQRVQDALVLQFDEGYPIKDLIRDSLIGYSDKEIKWALDNLDYKMVILGE